MAEIIDLCQQEKDLVAKMGSQDPVHILLDARFTLARAQ